MKKTIITIAVLLVATCFNSQAQYMNIYNTTSCSVDIVFYGHNNANSGCASYYTSVYTIPANTDVVGTWGLQSFNLSSCSSAGTMGTQWFLSGTNYCMSNMMSAGNGWDGATVTIGSSVLVGMTGGTPCSFSASNTGNDCSMSTFTARWDTDGFNCALHIDP